MIGFPVLFHGFLTNSDTQVFNKDNVLPKIAFKGNVRGFRLTSIFSSTADCSSSLCGDCSI